MRHWNSDWRFFRRGITLADHARQTDVRVYAGQEVRVINLPADAQKGYSVFEELHGFSDGKAFARFLTETARECYGTPIRKFLRRVVGRQDELRRQFQVFWQKMVQSWLPQGEHEQVSRLAQRFALATFAGEHATELGFADWESEQATEAAA